MICPNCVQLAAEFERRKLDYASAVADLANGEESPFTTTFVLLRATADGARIDLDLARLEIEGHKRIHTEAN
jgi:hypothetical protein